MARKSSQKVAAGRKGGRASGSRRSSSSLERNYRNYRDTLLEWSERPAVKYVAGGLGLALLGRFAYSMSDRYPEIARFIRENIDTVEDKLREFRGIDTQENVEARH
jgi:hypothetical protein